MFDSTCRSTSSGASGSTIWDWSGPRSPFAPAPTIRSAPIPRSALWESKTPSACSTAARPLGIETLCGPYHSALGEFSGSGPTPDEWKWGVDSMRQVAEHAGQAGVMLGVEYLNRFETYLSTRPPTPCVSCARWSIRMPHDVRHVPRQHRGKEACRTRSALARTTRSTCISRKTIAARPARATSTWAETFDTLKETGYYGWMVVEAFGLALPEIAAATKIWRRMYTSEEQLARDALAFMKRETSRRLMK